MNNSNQEYYVIERPSDLSIPLLKANKNSASKKYWSGDYVYDGQPLVFSNKKKEKNLEKGITEKISSILFTADEIVIDDSLYKTMKELDIEGVNYTPSIYIANNGVWYENYWYVRILNEHDLWCRDKSAFNPEARTSSGWHYVYKYVLNEDAIERVPMAQRMLFNMGGVSMPVMCAHLSIVDIIKPSGEVSNEFFKLLTEYDG